MVIPKSIKPFWLCALVSMCVALLLDWSGILHRLELQSINRMFEARPWLCWSSNGLSRLNPKALWEYHEQHEIPRRIWAWDYTLSWLIGDNHPPVKNKIVIFNHSLEDEPPSDAVEDHQWMRPLLRYPTPRATIAQVVRLLAEKGARLIILDNDFPQYSNQDEMLALAIHESPIPVLMASTANRRAFAGGMQLEASSTATGVLTELQKLEPGVDVGAKYTGLTTIAVDEDQVVRRIFTRIPTAHGPEQSIIIKASNALGRRIVKLPSILDIDFASPPNSELYRVRPFSYLLDPTKVEHLNDPRSEDATVNGAIVIIGDGVQDVYPTPLTNVGTNLMSGAEVLAHSLETVARQSWLHRISGALRALYLVLICAVGAAAFTASGTLTKRYVESHRALVDWVSCIGIAAATYCAGFILFAYSGLIVPVVVPSVAVATGALAALLMERERLRDAEARAREIAIDDQRRAEFVRRINHDLKAPVTVLNWTLAKLKREGLTSATAGDRLEHLERTSDRLFGLIAELVKTYETKPCEKSNNPPQTDLRGLLTGATKLHESVAEMRGSTITLDVPSYPIHFKCDALEMSRIIDNIIRNAILHNAPGTNVEVSARKRANMLQIEISDNGAGIGKEDLRNIFDPGFTTSSEKDGHGLGLSIAKTFVEKAGGTITVESEEEIGTKFIISLPISEEIDGVIDTAVSVQGSAPKP